MTKESRYLGASKDLRDLMDEAREAGWQLSKTPGGHIKWVLPGVGVTFSSTTSSDHRERHNLRARLRRMARGLPATSGRRLTNAA